MTDDFIWHVYEHTIPAALDLLPGRMDTPAARAMLLAIGLQESRFEHRRQLGPGPARGFFQFELGGGVRGVLEHPLTRPIIKPICEHLKYPALPAVCHDAIEHNDVLATCFARLLLYTDPALLPLEREATKGWEQYLRNWRPGRPHPETWPAFYREAWQIVNGTSPVLKLANHTDAGADIPGGGAT